jgi:hypothetical protein
MKTIFKVILYVGCIAFITSCTKEPPVLDNFDVIPSSTDILAGTAVDFTIEGEADFITFYSGLPGSEWKNYPAEKGNTVSIENSRVYSKVYNLHGIFTSTFVATSYGNWSKDEETSIKVFQINVTDNRTGVADFRLITGSLLKQKEWQGTINTDNNTIVVNVTTGTSITSVKGAFITDSPYAVITVNDVAFENNKTKLDYTNPVVFKITAPDGSSVNWTVSVIVG